MKNSFVDSRVRVRRGVYALQETKARKGLACSEFADWVKRAIHAPLIFKEKRRYELRDYEQGKDSLVVAQFTRLLYYV